MNRQRHDAIPAGGKGLIVASSFLDPAPHDVASIISPHNLWRVKIITVDQDVLCLRNKPLFFETSREICRKERFGRVFLYGYDQYMPLTEIKEVGAFPHGACPERFCLIRIAC